MRKLIPIAFIVCILLSGYFALRTIPTSNPRPARPVRIASSEWEPFIGPELADNGPMATIMTETMRRMGYEPEISFASWELIQEQTSRSEVLGVFPLILSEERERKYNHSVPILGFEYVLFYDKRRIQNPEQIHDVRDLANGDYTFGKVAGYDVWPELADAVGEFDELYDTDVEAFQALARGDIDFLPEGRLSGLVTVSGADIATDANIFGVLEAPADSGLSAELGLHFMMAKSDESERFLEAFNAALTDVYLVCFHSFWLLFISTIAKHKFLNHDC